MNDIEGNNQMKEEGDRVETLRRILEREQSKPVPYAEALEVAESLITFFEVLADDTEPDSLASSQEVQRA